MGDYLNKTPPPMVVFEWGSSIASLCRRQLRNSSNR
jgi:hypothetical protein